MNKVPSDLLFENQLNELFGFKGKLPRDQQKQLKFISKKIFEEHKQESVDILLKKAVQNLKKGNELNKILDQFFKVFAANKKELISFVKAIDSVFLTNKQHFSYLFTCHILVNDISKIFYYSKFFKNDADLNQGNFAAIENALKGISKEKVTIANYLKMLKKNIGMFKGKTREQVQDNAEYALLNPQVSNSSISHVVLGFIYYTAKVKKSKTLLGKIDDPIRLLLTYIMTFVFTASDKIIKDSGTIPICSLARDSSKVQQEFETYFMNNFLLSNKDDKAVINGLSLAYKHIFESKK